ncbi:MAG: PAS domain S-box protein [Candidatus Omnitrophica bacterium]|nr:PAS domain S-box protein [Candidatus Omnitrophota bacterium]
MSRTSGKGPGYLSDTARRLKHGVTVLSILCVLASLTLLYYAHRSTFDPRYEIWEIYMGYFIVLSVIMFTALGHKSYLVIEHEFTERRRAEEILRKSEEKYRSFFITTRDCIYMVEKNGRWIDVNQSFVRLFGYDSKEDLMRVNMQDMYVDVNQRWTHLSHIEKYGYSENYEVELMRKDGRPLTVLVNSVPIHDGAKGTVIGYQGTLKDVTEERRAQRLRDEFISTVSHELRTPITSIREGVSQVLEGILGPTTPEQREFLSMSLEDIDRLRRIIDNLLDISKIEAGRVDVKREWVDLMELAKGAAATFEARCRKKGIGIRVLGDLRPVRAYVDQDKVVQVFSNLIGNAVKFTERGGIEIGIEEKNAAVECSVKDTGKGIDQEELPRLFDKFQQVGRAQVAGEKGSGLGLSIVKGLVELHRGHISVESALGTGTKFTFTLPRVTAREWFKECVAGGVEESVQKGDPLSLLVFNFSNSQELERELGLHRLSEFSRRLEREVSQTLRRSGDIAVGDEQGILVMLPQTPREDARKVSRRIQGLIDHALSREVSKDAPGVVCQVAAYPGDGSTAEELLHAVQFSGGK